MGGKVLTLWSEELLAKGIAEGKAEGQNILVQAIQRLKKGETSEELIVSGIDQQTVELAKACL